MGDCQVARSSVFGLHWPAPLTEAYNSSHVHKSVRRRRTNLKIDCFSTPFFGLPPLPPLATVDMSCVKVVR